MPNLKNKKVIKDQQGQRKYPGLVTEIQGNTMATTGYGDIPLYVVPNVGNPMVVPANSGNKVFPGASSFTEFPIAKNGGWLEKYQDGGKKQLEDNDSWLENIAEIADPTGISSWDDIYRAYKNTGLSGETALELLGSIPLLGKVKKAGRLVDDLANAFAITKRQKNNAKITSGALKSIGKYGPSAGRVTDAVQAVLGAKDNSGFTSDIRHGEAPKYNGRNIFPQIELGEHGDYAYGGWLEKYQDGGIKIQQDNTYVNKNIDEDLINSFINNNNSNNSNNSNIDITKLTKPQQIDYGIKKVLEKEDPKSRKNLETLLKTTSYMENNYGSNKNAYNRKYTNSFMSVDDIAVKDIFTGKGDNNAFTKGQLNQLKRLNELNLPSDQVEFTKLLKKDNPTAAIAAARIVYANSPESLPDSNDPKKVFEYYYKYYNKAGASKYGNKDKDYKRFLEGYNKYSPQNKQDNSQWLDKY
jgi:hypothetical protein